MGVNEAVLRLSLEDSASAKITAIATSMLTSVKLMEIGWGAVTASIGLFTGALGTAAGAVTGMAGAVASAGSQLFELSSKSADAIKGLDNLSKSLQVDVKDLQLFIKAAGDMGIEQSAVTTGFRTLQMTIAQAMAGNESAVKSFESLGVQFKDANGGAREASAVMKDVGQAISKVGGGAGATAAAIDLFGRSGSQLIPLFQQWDTAMEGADESLDTFGQRLSKESIDAATRFKKTLGDMGDAVGSFGTYLGTSLMGTFGDAMSKVEAAIKSVFKGISIADLGIGIKLMISSVVEAIPFDWLVAKSTGVINSIIEQVLLLFGTVIRAFQNIPWWEISKSVMVILPVVTDLVSSAWGAIVSMMKASYTRGWDAAQAFVPMMVGLIGRIASDGVRGAGMIAEAFKTAANGAMELFQRALNFSNKMEKVVAFLRDPSAENLKAIKDVSDANDKLMAEMAAGYKTLANEDAMWWAGLQQRADQFGANMKTSTAPIVEAVDAARSASDKVAEAIARASQEMGRVGTQTNLASSDVDKLKKNFYMAGEGIDSIDRVAKILGIDLKNVVKTAGEIAPEIGKGLGQYEQFKKEQAEEEAARAAKAKKDADDAGAGKTGRTGSSGGPGGSTPVGGRTGGTGAPPPIGTTVSGDTTTTTYSTYGGGRIGGGGGGGATSGGLVTSGGATPIYSQDGRIVGYTPPSAAQQAATRELAAMAKTLNDLKANLTAQQIRAAEKAIEASRKQLATKLDNQGYESAREKMVGLAEDWRFNAQQKVDRENEKAASELAKRDEELGSMQKRAATYSLNATTSRLADIKKNWGDFEGSSAARAKGDAIINAAKKLIDRGDYRAAQTMMDTIADTEAKPAGIGWGGNPQIRAGDWQDGGFTSGTLMQRPPISIDQYGDPVAISGLPPQIVGGRIGQTPGAAFLPPTPIGRRGGTGWGAGGYGGISGDSMRFGSGRQAYSDKMILTSIGGGIGGGAGGFMGMSLYEDRVGGGGLPRQADSTGPDIRLYSGSKPQIRADQWQGGGPVSIGTFGQESPPKQTSGGPVAGDVNIDGQKIGTVIYRSYVAGAWTVPKSAVKDAR